MNILLNLFYLAILCLGLYRAVQNLRRSGPGMMRLFWKLVLAIAAFAGLFLFPLVYSNLLERHPNTFFTILFSGMGLFVLGIFITAYRVNRALQASQTSAPPEA